ncbi:MAG TPA: 3-methyl-2-oxobutanoate hydroxymethyltransferase [Steroidobacteraceae bacterium]|nr:3-methyl-2-oxobutanoate hydroxymethyltransferase [Steroidobacteraceae bacterium]
MQERYAQRPPVNISVLNKMKAEGQKIACITAYDASFAALVDEADVDVVLVGDSLGMVIQGHSTTVPVTLEDVIYHCKAVSRGLYRPFLMADMPFMTYASREQALNNAVRLMQEGGAKMVKLEGGASQADIVEFLANHDIAVCAHLGLKPQSVHKAGGFRVQGRDDHAAEQMRHDAKLLESAGADVVLLECIPAALGAQITADLHVPVIGIGAGPDTDGQILVLYDVLDITSGPKPKFAKNFMAGVDSPLAAIRNYVTAVRNGSYPAPEHCFLPLGKSLPSSPSHTIEHRDPGKTK